MQYNLIFEQIVYAVLYYLGLIAIVRLAGKRLAGQMATMDLIILISLGVILQNLTLAEGKIASAVFIITVLFLHILLTRASSRYPKLRRILREQPRPLIKNGRVIQQALTEEGLTEEELLAALRKMGCDSPQGIRLAVLEETGHITVVKSDNSG